MSAKKPREWWRGAADGYASAKEKIEKYGYAHAQLAARDLKLNARREGDAYDKGYAAAYDAIANGKTPWFPNGTHNAKESA